MSNKRTKHRWLYKLMLFGLLLPAGTTAVAVGAEAAAPSAVVTTVHAIENPASTGAKPNSAWDQALDTLGKDAKDKSDPMQHKNDKNTTDSDQNNNGGGQDKKQADFLTILNSKGDDGGSYMNIWGFLGQANTTFWNGSNSSSLSTSYDGLSDFTTGGNQDTQRYGAAYNAAGRYAYVMQSVGLDQGFKSGFKKPSFIYQIAGVCEQVAYVVLGSADRIFDAALRLLEWMNPIAWARNGISSAPASFAPLARVVHELYGASKSMGVAIIGLILAGSLTLAALGITVGTGQAHVGQGKAITNTFVNLLKRLFVFAILPVFVMYFFDATVKDAQGIFDDMPNAVSNYAVFGSMVDYNHWVLRSRLDLPAGVRLSSSLSEKNITPLTHAEIMKINQDGAGYTQLSGLTNSVSGNASGGGVNLMQSDSSNNQLDNQAKAMINSFKRGDSIQASDYGAAVEPGIRTNAAKQSDDNGGSSDSELSQELTKTMYNDNAHLNNGGNYTDSFRGSGIPANGSLLQGYDQSRGGLSTLGMYAYLETTADGNSMDIVAPAYLSNETAQPRHRSVVIVGTGIEQTGNLVWSFGLAVGLAFLVAGYIIETLKTIIESVMGLTAGVVETAFASLRGGVKLISIAAAVAIGVFGSAMMYMVATKAYIAIASMSDTLLQGTNSIVSSVTNFMSFGAGSNSDAVGLASSVNAITVNGAVNIFEGVFLLWVAYLLLHYRGVVVASLASLVEETANRIMATFGSLSGQGSSGTRGMILSNSNTQNTVGNAMSGMARSAAPLAAAGAGLGGLKALESKFGGKDKSTLKGADQKHNNNKQGTRTSQFGSRSSSNKRGFAAERIANNSGMTHNNDRNNAKNNQAKSLVERSNEQNGLRESANEGAGYQQGGFQNLAYSPNAGDNSRNASNWAGDQEQNSLRDAGSIGGSINDKDAMNVGDMSNMNSDGSSIGMDNDTNNAAMNDAQTDMSNGLDRDEALQNGLDGDTMNGSDGLDQNGLDQNGLSDAAAANSAEIQDLNGQGNDVANQLYGDQSQNMAGAQEQNSLRDAGSIGMDNDTNNAAMNDAQTDMSNGLDRDEALQNGLDGDTMNGSDGLDQNGLDQNGLDNEPLNTDASANGLDGQNANGLSDAAAANSAEIQDLNGQGNDVANQLYGNQSQNMAGAQNRNVAGNHNQQNQHNGRNSSRNSQNMQNGRNQSGQSIGTGAANRNGSISMNSANNGLMNNNVSNSLQSTPINKNASSASVQSKMGDIHQANAVANRATSLAEANPSNKTLHNQAEAAKQNLTNLQNNAMMDYNSQAINSNMPQNSWLSSGTDGSNMSVGTANTAVDKVYDAQQKLSAASDRYGASSPQVQQATQQLNQARKAAVGAGLDSSMVNNTKAITAAHAQIADNAAKLMSGTWTPQGGAAFKNSSSTRAIGI